MRTTGGLVARFGVLVLGPDQRGIVTPVILCIFINSLTMQEGQL